MFIDLQTRPLYTNEGNQTTRKGTSPKPPRRMKVARTKGVYVVLPETHVWILDMTVFNVPNSFDSGTHEVQWFRGGIVFKAH